MGLGSLALSLTVLASIFSPLFLEGQVRCEEEGLAKARQRCSDLEVLTEKTKVELDALVDSLSSADQNINENNVEKEKMLNNLAVEEIDLNNLEADNLMLQAEE